MRFRTFNLLAGSSLLVLSSVAGAQTAGTGASELSLEEIVVTARRVEERLQDVPISMTVFNSEQLSKANVVNAGDLARITPSLSTNDNFGSENTSYAIRGFVQDAGTAPSVGVYFADVVAPRGPTNGTQAGDGAGPGYFFDLQNVQVLKGPQGTLQGRNTTGGAVLFVPKKPTSELGGYAEISAGNYSMKRLEAAVNLPISDTARLRVAVDRQQRDGYLINNSGIGPDDFNNVNYLAARASLVVDLTPNLENYLIGSYSNSDTHGSVQKLIACDSSFAGLAGFSCAQVARNNARGDSFYTLQSGMTNPKSILKQYSVINTTTWHASDTLTIKNIISHASLSNDQRTSLFGTDWKLNLGPGGIITLPFTAVQTAPGLKGADQSTFTEELQLQGNALDQQLTYQGGIYFESSRPNAKVGYQSPFLAYCTNAETFQCTDFLGGAGAVNYTVGETTTRDVGLYTQSTYTITDQFKVTGGFRYTWDNQRNDSTRISYRFPAPNTPTPGCTDVFTAPSCEQHLDSSSSAPTWLLDFDYKPTDDMLVYLSYKRGYRSGGTFVNAPSTYRTFDPEKVDTYELGFKSSFRGAVSGTFNIAGFYNDFSNQQLQFGFDAVTGSGQSSTTAIVNAGKSRIFGTEVEGTISPVEGLVFGLNYTYLNTKIESIANIVSTDPNFTSELHIEKGDPLVLSPKNKYALSGTYTLPFADSVGKVSLGATFVHTDKQLANYVYLHSPTIVANMGGDYGTLKERNLLNVNLGWDAIMGLPLDVSLFSTNVTNQKYYSFVAGLVGAGFESATLSEPRMVGARVRFHFGGN